MPFELRSPVTSADLSRLDGRPEIVQFDSALTEADHVRLGEWCAEHPTKTLRAYGSVTDLEFLRHYPTLRSFAVEGRGRSLTDLAGLRHLPSDTVSLRLGGLSPRAALAPLARLTGLEDLSVEGPVEDLSAVRSLTGLRRLDLRSITLPDLAPLTGLGDLRSLALRLGGTTDLGLLPVLERLEHLELWQVRGLADLSPVAGLPRLELLHLQALRRVEALPEMSGLLGLRRLWLETMKGVDDLTPICAAPGLRQLAVIDAPHLQPEAFASLVGHPTLVALRAGLGSRRKNDAVARLVGLPAEESYVSRW